jgi:hypothetical protein
MKFDFARFTGVLLLVVAASCGSANDLGLMSAEGNSGGVSANGSGGSGVGGQASGGQPSSGGIAGSGGEIQTGGTGGDGPSDGGPKLGDAGSFQGGAGEAGGGGTGCALLQKEAASALRTAQSCSVKGLNESCQVVEGICCTTYIWSTESPEGLKYLSALQAFKDAGCVPNCSESPCKEPTSGVCKKSGTAFSCTVT